MTKANASRIQMMLASTILSTAAMVTPAAAQNADEEVKIEEIQVTASKRGAQNLIDVPSTIQAIGGNDLRALGAKDFADWAGTVPGLAYEDLGPGDKDYVIRGVNSSGDATVGVYYDEAVITGRFEQDGGGRNADIKVYDIQQIEVLKGPQGTLYGASSLTGTIRLVTNKPKMNEFEDWVEGGANTIDGGGEGFQAAAMLNVPLVDDKVAVRAVGWYHDEGGFIDNTRLGLTDINDEEAYGGRVHVLMEPTENFSLLASATYQSLKSGGSSRFTPEGRFGAGVPGADAFLNARPGGDYENTEHTQSPWDEDLYILSLTADWDLGGGSLTATTNLYDREIEFAFDSSPILFFFGVPVAGVTLQPQSRELWTSEIRYASNLDGPLNYVIGGFISRENSDFETHVIASGTDGLALAPFRAGPANDFFGGGTTFFGRTLDDSRDQEAIFGEVTFEMTEKFTLTAGARWFNASIDSRAQVIHDFVSGAELDPLVLEGSEDDFTFRFNAAYQPSENLTFFAQAASGFRQGGVNSPGFSGVVVPPSFGSDTLWSYEAGVKTRSDDGAFSLDLSVYQIDWSDIQTQDFISGFSFITNAGKARVKGIEGLMTYTASNGLEVSLGGTYTDAQLTQNQPASPGASGRDGDRVPNVPRFSGNIALTKYFDIASDWDASLRLDYIRRGSSATDFNPLLLDGSSNINFADIPSYNIVNTTLRFERDTFDISIYAKNLFNKLAFADVFINGDQDPLSGIALQPFTLGITLRQNF